MFLSSMQLTKYGPNSKPAGDHSTKIRLQKYLGTMIFATLLAIGISGSRHEEKDLGLVGAVLGQSSCPNAEKIQICSHQILNVPAMGLLGFKSPPDGSVRAMELLWDAGIHCFDIDAITLRDGSLLASHPSRFAAAVGHTKVETFTLDQSRRDGADDAGFPLLHDILKAFSALVKRDGAEGSFYRASRSSDESQDFPRLDGPWLNIDLKGPHLTTEHLRNLTEYVEGELGIGEHVSLCVTALEDNEKGPGVDILRAIGGGDEQETRVPLGLTLRDLVENDGDANRVRSLVTKYPAIKVLVPSNKFDTSYFNSIAAFGMPVVSWTVDEESGLIKAIKEGLSGIISNDPIDLSEKLRILRQQCAQFL